MKTKLRVSRKRCASCGTVQTQAMKKNNFFAEPRKRGARRTVLRP